MPATNDLTELTTTGTMTIPEAGFTLRSISALADDTPAGSDTYTITVYINGTPSTLSVVLTNANSGQANFTLPAPIPLTAGDAITVLGQPLVGGEPGTLGVSATVGFGITA